MTYFMTRKKKGKNIGERKSKQRRKGKEGEGERRREWSKQGGEEGEEGDGVSKGEEGGGEE